MGVPIREGQTPGLYKGFALTLCKSLGKKTTNKREHTRYLKAIANCEVIGDGLMAVLVEHSSEDQESFLLIV